MRRKELMKNPEPELNRKERRALDKITKKAEKDVIKELSDNEEREVAFDEISNKVIKATNKKDGSPSSMKNVFIRVSRVNKIKEDNEKLGLKAGDILIYEADDIKRILDNWCKSKQGITYFFIKHDRDGVEGENVHYHIVICFGKGATPYEQIKNRFPYGNIAGCLYGVHRTVQYLVHMNHPAKFQYDWKEVISNDYKKLEDYKLPYQKSLTVRLNETIDAIVKGEIKEFEIDKIDKDIYVKKERYIKSAFEYRRKLLIQDQKRNISVIVLAGPSRVGKTTFCRAWAEKHKKSYCLSGGSRDVWGDYMGEDIFVYDDTDFSDTKISDVLKVLDPYNNSSVSSRYHNKFFIGDTIFICTNTNVTNWFMYQVDGLREAFFKRITYVMQFNSISDDYVSDYTINKIVYSDEDPLKLYDENGYYKGCSKYRKLESIDGETHYFDLKPYINTTYNENKKNDLLKDIIDM